jgi:hypothetical protein
MTDSDTESELVYTGNHRTDSYHLTTACDYCPDDPNTIRKSVAESWGTLELCRDCSGKAHTGLSQGQGETDDTRDDETVVISERNELFHIPDRCTHQPEDPDTLAREAAEARGYRMCKFCDPAESATETSNHPASELPAQLREMDASEVFGDD